MRGPGRAGSRSGDRIEVARHALARVEEALSLGNCVGLFGPRQVGKTALANVIGASRGDGSLRLDLRQPDHRARLANAGRFLADNAGKLVILDEAHEMPAAFDIVHTCLEDQIHAGAIPTNFLILGSSSRALQTLAADRLGARMHAVDLGPIQAFELPSVTGGQKITASAANLSLPGELMPLTEIIETAEPPISLDQLWLRGGFPLSLLAADDEVSHRWRQRYINTCCGRELGVPGEMLQESGLRAALDRLAASPGRQMPLHQQSADFRACFARLEQLGLVRRLPAWFSNQEKRLRTPPELFIRDTGLLHALRGCRTSAQLDATDDLKGRSWESFCVEALVTAADGIADAYFYRDKQDELDLVLDFGGRRWGIEIKHGDTPRPSARFYRACNDVGVEHRFFIHRGAASITVGDGVRAFVLADALAEVLKERN